jgi:hypothetical protein
MNFNPTYTLESKTCPGVTVTLRRMGPKPRAATELQVSAARAKSRTAMQAEEKASAALRAALAGIPGLQDAIKTLPHDDNGALTGNITPEITAMFTPEVWSLSSERENRESEVSTISRAEIHPAFVLAAVKSIEGITSDDQPYTAALLCDIGPDDLFDEVVRAINDNTYATRVMAENLSLPTTSGAQVDGEKNSTSAQTAS